jgi:hypothetical protein
MKLFQSVLLFLVLAALSPGQTFVPGAPIVAPKVTTGRLLVTETILITDGTDTLAFWVTDSLLETAQYGDLLGTWKGKDTTAFGMLARASTWTGRQTFADLVTGDSAKCVTLNATGKITGGAGLGITGAGAFSGRVTATDIAVTDSAIGVTANFSGKITGGAGCAVTGAITGTTLAIGGGSTLAKLVYADAGDSVLLFIVGADTFKARK